MHDTLFNYQILRIIGEGGMSRVYLAKDPQSGQHVAIKEMLPDLMRNSDLRERFRKEAQVLAKLDNPNIVKLIRYEETDTNLYLIMEYIEGDNLENYINNITGPIETKKAVQIMNSVLDALNYAHTKGVIHRDVKPANIIITNKGEIKILDFGIAKQVNSQNTNATQAGTKLGTVSYMSPEQINAQQDIDIRTDIYSMGVLLHHMITGKSPYDTNKLSDFEIQTKIIKAPLPRINTIYPFASPDIQDIIDKATQKSRNNRFQDCNSFKTSLKQIGIQKISPAPKKTSQWSIVFSIIIITIIIFSVSQIKKSESANNLSYSPGLDYDTSETVIDSIQLNVVDSTVIAIDSFQQDYSNINYTSPGRLYERIISSPSVGNSTNHEVSILSVDIQKEYTRVVLRFENRSEINKTLYTDQPGGDDAYYIRTPNGNRFLLTWTNLTDINNPVSLPSGYYYDFTLQFEAIPISTTSFSLIEGAANVWSFYDVNVSN